MKITRSMLREMIEQEKKIISEDCGCGCNGAPGGCGDSYDYEDGDMYVEDLPQLIDYEDSLDSSVDSPMLSKSESLKAVYAIANSTSCPITRDALLSVISELM